jgi:hypothetical protein
MRVRVPRRCPSAIRQDDNYGPVELVGCDDVYATRLGRYARDTGLAI